MAEMDSVSGVDEHWTCGKGLAEQARLPAKMAELMGVLAENLEAHVPTIDTADAAGRAEREAYVHLSTEFAAVAARLARTAERMEGYRELSPARHHEESLGDPGLLEAFERFVAREKSSSISWPHRWSVTRKFGTPVPRDSSPRAGVSGEYVAAIDRSTGILVARPPRV